MEKETRNIKLWKLSFPSCKQNKFFSFPVLQTVIFLNRITSVKRKIVYTNEDLKFASTTQTKCFIFGLYILG